MTSPSRRMAVVMVVSAVLAAVGIWAVMVGGGHSEATRASIPPSATADGASPGGPGPFVVPGLPGTTGSLVLPEAAATPGDGTDGDGAAGGGDGSEVIEQPDGPTTDGLPGLEPPAPSSDASLIVAPLPRTASREGGMVDGFPVSIIPVLPGSVVQSSGVSSTSNTLQVSLVADGPRSPNAVLAFYRRALVAHGFIESLTPASPGSTAASFRRGADRLVVTTTDGSSVTAYSLFGTLRAGAAG